MTTKSFNVKDKSLTLFFKEYSSSEFQEDRRMGAESSAYYLMQDVITIKKSAGIKEDETVEFLLEDRAQYSGKFLTNRYIYKAIPYDDLSIQLQLMDFEVKVKEV